jgi:hypothetical protein
VGAVEHKTGTEVVERFLCHRRSLNYEEPEKNEHQYPCPVEAAIGAIFAMPSGENHCSDLTSLKD